MPTQLKASLKLDLQDQLTAGLDRLRGGTGSVDNLTKALRGTESQADRAAGAIKRMAQSANDNVIRVGTDGVARLGRAFGAIAGGRGGAGGGGGGGDASFFDGPLLGGPGSPGGIPLNLRPSRGAGLGAALHGVTSAAGGFGEAGSNLVNKGFGAAVEGFAVYEPIKQYAEFDNILRHIGITEKLSGEKLEAEISRLRTLFDQDALSTGQSSTSIAHAYSDLVQTGIPASVLDKAIKAHSEAATAYNISPDAMGPAVGALLQNMKIAEGDLGSALAAMAVASKEGRFKVEDFSRQLPGTTGYLSLLGMTGRKSADIGFAGLETVMKNSSEPNQAAADFNDALHYLTSPIANRSFAKGGIDLPGLLRNAAKQGINPLDAVLGKLDQKTAGMDPIAAAEYLGKLLHNQQAGMAILSLLQHKSEFLKLRDALDHVGRGVLDTDFQSAFAAPLVQLRLMGEQAAQLVRIFGHGFGPVLAVVNIGLAGLLKGLTWMNTHMPKTLQIVLTVVAGMLLLGAAVTLIGVIVPAFVAGWGLVTAALTAFGAVLGVVTVEAGPWLIIAGLIATAVYKIYENWGPIAAWFHGVVDGIRSAFDGMANFFEDTLKSWFAPFEKFMQDVREFLREIGSLGNDPNIKAAIPLTPKQIYGNGGEGGADAKKIYGGAPPAKHTLDINVRADPGTTVSDVKSDAPFTLYGSHPAPNTGKVLGRH